jgi:transcriptional regulator with XRE-family HTH domain
MMPNPISFYRQRAGLSQRDLAAQSGLTLDYLRDLEGGKKERLTMRLAPVAFVLNEPVDALMI